MNINDIVPAPLAPLGPTDSWTYPNGVMITYSPGYVHIYTAPYIDPVITLSRKVAAVIKAVLVTLGLSDHDAALVVEAVETYAR